MVVVVEATVVQRKVSEPEEGDESIPLREGVAGMGSQSEKGDRGPCFGMVPPNLLEPG